MSEDKSKLQLIGEIAEANNKNLELIVEMNRQAEETERLNNIIKEVREYIEENTKEGILKEKKYFYSPEQANDILEILDKGE